MDNKSGCTSAVAALSKLMYLVNERGIQADQIVLIGYSIGCFASVHLACSISQPPAGIVLQSPPTSVLRVLLWERACFKKPFQQRSCCADRFCTYDKIGGIRVSCIGNSWRRRSNGSHNPWQSCLRKGSESGREFFFVAAPLWLRATHDNVENCRETWIRIRTFIK
ncbi:hypothetical protein OSTOST_19015, partial [Ostertagia ostertagi]